MDWHLYTDRRSPFHIQDTTAWRVFYHLPLCFSICFLSFSSSVTLPETVWTALSCLTSLFLCIDLFLFFSSTKTVVYFTMIFFFWPPPLLLFSSYLCVAFSFCFSFLLPANDNQHTDGKPVPVSLSSLPSFSFQFPVTQPDTKPPIIYPPFISCPALSACCRHINCRLLCSDPPFPRTMLIYPVC